MFNNIYILFPDPWPKKKHHKRRIMNEENLIFFSKILKPEGKLRFVTDHRDYLEYALEQILVSGKYDWQECDVQSLLETPKDHVETKYERKARLQGSEIYYVTLEVRK